MDTKDIHYFISVFEHRSFTKSAEKIHVVQSTLSTRIRNIEEQLKTSLFDRTPSGLVPTQAGYHLYELCVPIARDLAAATQQMNDLVTGDVTTGVLRIGINSPMCRNTLGHILPRFNERYPNFDIVVSEGYARDITEQVQIGNLDVGLGALPLGQSSAAWTHAFTDRYALVSGQDIHGPSMTPISVSQMSGLTLVLPSGRHLLREVMNDHIASGRVKPSKIVTITGSVATFESIRESDWGAFCLMNSMVEQIGRENVFIYPIVNPKMYLDLYIVHDRRRPLNMPAKIFVNMLRTRLKEMQQRWLDIDKSDE